MDFTPINRLKLKEAFEDNHKFQIVTCDQDFLTDLFEHTDRGIIFVHDNEELGYSTFISDTNGLGADKTFKISNNSHADIFLWHIDGVLYKKDSKCDCAFLSDRRIGFVEFKSNASNNTEVAIKENYEKAKTQLKLTIQDIADRCNKIGVEINECSNIEAHAVFNRTVPRLNAYQKKLAASFLFETNGIPSILTTPLLFDLVSDQYLISIPHTKY